MDTNNLNITCEISSLLGNNLNVQDISYIMYNLCNTNNTIFSNFDTIHIAPKSEDNIFLIKLEIPHNVLCEFSFENSLYSVIRLVDETAVKANNGGLLVPEKIIIKSKTKENIEKLLNHIVKEFEDNSEKKKHRDNRNYINIYVYEEYSYWNLTCSQPKRSLDTIYIDDDSKKSIIKDIQKFIDDKELYEKFGIPYKRNYLFIGIPGTGKTSFVHAIASKFNLDIYTAKLSTKEKTLEYATKTIKKDSILLIEDIEHCFPSESDEKQISISDLLQLLDGIVIKHRLMIFMTSNSVTRIPKVLLRPGRVDKILKFTFCTKDQIINIHSKFCPDENGEKFYNSVKHLSLTPVILQQFLFRKSPEERTMSELEELVNSSKEKYKDAMYS